MRKMRIGFLGIAHVHSESYMRCIGNNDSIELAGIYDEDKTLAESAGVRFGVHVFSDPNELFLSSPDVVIVTSENNNHRRDCILAMDRGFDVLCEKPLAAGIEDLEAILASARHAGARLMTALPNRYIPAYERMVDAYRKGEFGELLGIKATNKGEMPGKWFVNPELSGGGCLIDHTVHVADLLNNMLSCIPVSIESRANRKLYPELEVESAGLSSIAYPGGLDVLLDSSWSRTAHFPYARDLTFHVMGTEKSCAIDYFAESDMVYAAVSDHAERSYYGDNKDQLMIDELARCYLEHRDFPITGVAGARCAIVAIAAVMSFRENRKIMLDELISDNLRNLLEL